MLELADETDSKSVVRKGVWVRLPPPAPYKNVNIDMESVNISILFLYRKAIIKAFSILYCLALTTAGQSRTGDHIFVISTITTSIIDLSSFKSTI